MTGQIFATLDITATRTVSVDVGVGAVVLEVRVVLDARRRAGRRGVVLAAAAVRGVGYARNISFFVLVEQLVWETD